MPELKAEKSPLELSPPNPLLRPVGLIFTIFIAIIFAIIVGIGGWDTNNTNQIPEENNTDLVPSTNQQNPAHSSCTNVSSEEVQGCCSEWAINNDLMTPKCIGSWEVQEGQCSWICGSASTL